MELLFAIGNIGFGSYMTLTGFKVYNPFKGKDTPEKEEAWYKKFGTFFKIGGILLVGFGLYSLLNNI
ncbi:MAG: hypothetical protein OCD76_06840 [Reichenbachiella sp.]